MRHYPLFLDLTAKTLLVVGAGAVGRRKLASLLACSPGEVRVVDPRLSAEECRELEASGPVSCRVRSFVPEDLEGVFLAFAATADRVTNAWIAALCRERGILCNVADAPSESDFCVPAQVRCEGVTVALSTGGLSPALARRMASELEAWMGTRYTPLLALLGRLRSRLLALGLPTRENAAVFRAVAASSLGVLLEREEYAAAAALLVELLPESLHPCVGELLHEH